MTIKIIDFNKITGLPYEKRNENVLYQTGDFKIRVIDLPVNGTIPECDMATHVVFYVIEGNVDIIVNGEEYILSEKQSLASEPAAFSMKANNGAKLMGIQILKHEE